MHLDIPSFFQKLFLNKSNQRELTFITEVKIYPSISIPMRMLHCPLQSTLILFNLSSNTFTVRFSKNESLYIYIICRYKIQRIVIICMFLLFSISISNRDPPCNRFRDLATIGPFWKFHWLFSTLQLLWPSFQLFSQCFIVSSRTSLLLMVL